MRLQRGFTLVEVLVALAILAILMGGAVLTLPDAQEQQRRESLRAWQRQAETAALRAEREARPWAWEIGPRSARLLQRVDGRWQPAPGSQGDWLALEGELGVTALEIEGQRREAGSLIVFAGIAPLFTLHLAGGGRSWQLSGQPSGLITLETAP